MKKKSNTPSSDKKTSAKSPKPSAHALTVKQSTKLKPRHYPMKSNRNPVGWFEIYVQDMERAKAFYQKTLHVSLEHLESPDLEMWAFPPLMQPDNPGCTGSLVKMEGKDSGVGGTIVYFVCEDCAVEAGRAAQNGGKVQKEKMSIGHHGFIALVLDPDGNMIGLHSMK